MDSFINLAKQGFEAYSESKVSKTGGHELNRPDHSSGYDNTSRPDLDHDEVVGNASKHGSGDSSMFSSALSFINNNQNEHEHPIDEEEVVKSHEKAYGEGDTSDMSARSLGSAAALHALKKYTSGGGDKDHKSSSSSQLISLAMAEASKLFDKSDGKVSGNKQDAVNGAAMTVMKLLVQSKFSGHGATGGGHKSSTSSLMGLASKFF